ncbi:hypothetical protein [Glycomyces xiaoerkulensis]|uniref:hypothetical protein n=1 Tax=Glycomyces xiaoerkulensis TaxID=2038139 RepID=UPI000C26AD94|nr:hypothetical protein [Glycomyces xiaoerkulensis]
MDYLINFDSSTSPAVVKRAVIEQWGLHPANVFAGADFELDTYDGPELDVIIQSGIAAGSSFGTEMQAGIDFAMRCDYASELAVATELCLAIGTRAVISAELPDPTRSVLITEDGWHGRVALDSEELERGAIMINFALQPIPSAPTIPVRTAACWDAGALDFLRLPKLGFAPMRRLWDC